MSEDILLPLRYRIEELLTENSKLRREVKRLEALNESYEADVLDDMKTTETVRTKRTIAGYYEAAYRAVRTARVYSGSQDDRTKECLYMVRRYRRIIRKLRGTL